MRGEKSMYHIHSEEARDDHDHEIREDEGYIWQVQKLPKGIASNLLWWEVYYYSNDAAEALTSPANLPCMPPASTHSQRYTLDFLLL
jgi:hypothetical protein